MMRARRAERERELRQQQVATLGAPAAEALGVLWIVPHATRLTRLPAELRAAQVAYLDGLANSDGAAASAPADAGSQAEPVVPAEGHLCGWCGGRCCGQGGFRNAYLGLPHLRRWQQDHPGSTLQDAAAAYAERMPEQHVETSCMYHGARGCTLDRTMRSDICNRYACDGLRELQHRQTTEPASNWLFVMARHADVESTSLCRSAPATDTP